MSKLRPIVIAILHANTEDVGYQLQTQCYGLQMQIDNEWDADLILLVPSEHIASVVEDSGVTSEDTRIVTAGITDVPRNESGLDFALVRGKRNNWVLIGDPRQSHPDPRLDEQVQAAIEAGCRLIVCVDDMSPNGISSRLTSTRAMAKPDRVIVVVTDWAATEGDAAQDAIKAIRNFLGSDSYPVVVGRKVTEDSIGQVLNADGISGVFLTESDYADFTDLLLLLRKVGE